MSIRYNLESDSVVQALLNKQRYLIQDQADLISRQDAIIGSLACIVDDIQRYGYSKMQVVRLRSKIDHLEDKLTEVQDA